MIQKIAGQLLNYIYVVKVEENRTPKVEELIEKSEYPPHQVNMALDYCQGKDFLKLKKMCGTNQHGVANIILFGITSAGMDMASNTDKFKKYFGIGVNLGLVNFKWGVKEQ